MPLGPRSLDRKSARPCGIANAPSSTRRDTDLPGFCCRPRTASPLRAFSPRRSNTWQGRCRSASPSAPYPFSGSRSNPPCQDFGSRLRPIAKICFPCNRPSEPTKVGRPLRTTSIRSVWSSLRVFRSFGIPQPESPLKLANLKAPSTACFPARSEQPFRTRFSGWFLGRRKPPQSMQWQISSSKRDRVGSDDIVQSGKFSGCHPNKPRRPLRRMHILPSTSYWPIHRRSDPA